jgi:hypothetical protein
MEQMVGQFKVYHQGATEAQQILAEAQAEEQEQ